MTWELYFWHLSVTVASVGIILNSHCWLEIHSGQGLIWHIKLGYMIVQSFIAWGLSGGTLVLTLDFQYKGKPQRIEFGGYNGRR